MQSNHRLVELAHESALTGMTDKTICPLCHARNPAQGIANIAEANRTSFIREAVRTAR
jgi:hypothetical protein